MFQKGIDGEEGIVTAVRGNIATVKIQANEGCDKCRLCMRLSSTEMAVNALINKPVSIGNRVVLSIRPGTITKSAVILYILPLMGLILGYYTGKVFFRSFAVAGKEELFPAICSLFFLFASFIPIWIYDRKKKKDSRFQVYIRDRVL